tara:strand:+ start:2011 stop:2418 length:408 start_codon:yes stop_codon:yes gene_type:complete
MNKIIKCSDLKFKVYVEDTDFQGVVYHANYIKFFERARSDFLENNNISQKNLKKYDLAFVIKKIEINYLLAAELGDILVVKSSVEKKSNARLIFYQKVVGEGDKEFVNGKVEVCLINLVTKKPKKFPDDLLLIFD